MQINREKLIEMYGVFERLAKDKCSVKFHYTVLKNKRLIQPEIDSIREVNEPHPKYQEFEKKRMELCHSFTEKDENGKSKIENNNFIIPQESREEFDKQMNDLKTEYQEMFDNMDEKQKEFENLLKEDVEIELITIPMSIIPKELTGQEVEVLFDIIEED